MASAICIDVSVQLSSYLVDVIAITKQLYPVTRLHPSCSGDPMHGPGSHIFLLLLWHIGGARSAG